MNHQFPGALQISTYLMLCINGKHPSDAKISLEYQLSINCLIIEKK